MTKTKILVPGASYYLKQKKSGRYLDGHGDDSTVDKKSQSTNSDGIDPSQEWSFEELNGNKYNSSSYYLKHTKTGRYLDGHGDDKTVDKKHIDSGSGLVDDSKVWELKPLTDNYDGYNYLNHCKTGRQLDGKGDDDSVYKLKTGLPNEYQMWEMSFAELETNIIYDRIDYGTPQIPNTVQDGLQSQIVDNQSNSAQITQTVTLSRELTSTFQWSFTETLSESIAVGVTAKWTVPFEVGVDVSSTTTFTLSSTQAQTVSEAVTYSVSQQVTAPPHSKVQCDGYVNWADNVQSEFTMIVRFSATASGIPLNNQQLIQLLEETNSEYQLVDELNNQLLISLSGVFSGSYGIATGMTAIDI